ncbi:transcription initiation factor TFIID subunit 4 isoform X2 [Chanos chanos]|uniref:Transcription initiation factor TFIID subunit 4 isoform X2 n=1 Tax=Chanos chanos TaxID=29144 RepID=A0A6J2VMA6_CHACN|nr:transcription initiation factor TFIID subunit 4-like isoform X2 [Chanos chanos]
MDSHSESGAALSGTSVSSSSTSDASTTVTVVSNGPGITKEHEDVTVPSGSNTVIQAPLGNSQSVTTSSSGSGTTVTVDRPSMQTVGSGLTINGSNTALTTAANVANQSASTALGLTSQTPLLSSNPSSGSLSISTGVLIKPESPKTVIQTSAQNVSPGAIVSTGNVTLGQPLQSSPTMGKNVVLQATRAATPATVATTPGGIRAIAPQVLAPRLPQSSANQANVQNIQLPPGMVLVRSDSGQLLMIHQQMLAQMQAQSQATRPAVPAGTAQVQISTAQAPGTPIITRQVNPTSIIKQGSPAPSSMPVTTTLQRPPTLQNPTSVATTLPVQAGVTQRTVTASAGTTVALATETMENVKKCKNFLSTLIKLACSGKQSSETAASVKELVKSLLEGKIEAEDFTSKLYKELNSSPQPYLVPFLKRSVPALRQLTPDSNAFIQQSQTPQPRVATTQEVTITSSRLISSPVICKPGQPASQVLQPQQPGVVVKSPQATLTAAGPMVPLRAQTPSRIVVGQPQVQIKQLQTVPLKQGVFTGAKLLTTTSLSAVAPQNNKAKDAAGGTFKDDDDINDVASMAGVNLSEESARILATNSELVGAVMRSCKDETFLFCTGLHRRMLDIGKKFGITELGPDVVNLVSHATQQRLQSLLEKVSVISQQRNISFKQDDSRYEQVSDVRAQLKFFEQLDQVEKQRKEEQEREILMKAAKSRSRQEDPEQLRLKQKAKEMQQQELAQMRQREANLTALAAIGPRKKRKLDALAQGTDAEGSGSSGSLLAGSGTGTSRQFTRQRITRVNLRDLLFCLENERATSHSRLLYRGLLK